MFGAKINSPLLITDMLYKNSFLFCRNALAHVHKIQNHNKQKCQNFRKVLLDSFGNYIWKDINILHLEVHM